MHELHDQILCNVLTNNFSYFKLSELEYQMQPTEFNINELQNKIWYIIKQEDDAKNLNQNRAIPNENERFEIQLNNIIKLGRIKLLTSNSMVIVI